MNDDWLVAVDIFDVSMKYEVTNGEASLEDSNCNCDIEKEVCRHIALADSRVRAVFQDDTGYGLDGEIVEAPSQWRPIVSGDCDSSSETPV